LNEQQREPKSREEIEAAKEATTKALTEIEKAREEQRVAIENLGSTQEDTMKQIQKAKELSLKPMVARFFNNKGEEIEEESVEWKLGEDAFRFAGVGDAKTVGRRIGAQGFRIWDSNTNSLLFYIRPAMDRRFQVVNEQGFQTYFENIITANLRRKNIQLLRANNDPAYLSPKEAADAEA
jgi:hypothetical protein